VSGIQPGNNLLHSHAKFLDKARWTSMGLAMKQLGQLASTST